MQMNYTLSWTGDNGFTARGTFSVDPQFQGTVVTEEQLENLQLFFFDPTGTPLSGFNYNFPLAPEEEFNFNFDIATGTLLQTGNFDQPDGFDLGIDFNKETGLDFITFQDSEAGVPETSIFLEQIVTPGTDEGLIPVDEGGTLTARPQLINYDLFWQGEQGFFATGTFNFDSRWLGTTITPAQLNDMVLSLYDPTGTLIGSFDYNFPIPADEREFNFNFDTTTGTILQSGNFDQPNGFDLGIDFSQETGPDFISFQDAEAGFPETVIALDQVVTAGSDDDLIELDEGGTLVANRRVSIVDLYWEGNQGIIARGTFSFDSGYEGTVVTEEQLEDLQITFYDPTGTNLPTPVSFDYSFPTAEPEFNFNFDTVTNKVLQNGNFDQLTGFDLGINYETETGLDFITFRAPETGTSDVLIVLDQIVTPGTDEDLIPIAQGGVLAAFPRNPVDILTGITIEDIFDPGFYLASYPVVLATELPNFNNDPLQHFLAVGQYRGWAPSQFFDPGFYLEQNPDVAVGVDAGTLTAISHFINYGEFERRPPSINYDEVAYLAKNPEVVTLLETGEYATGVEHYLKVGQDLGLTATF